MRQNAFEANADDDITITNTSAMAHLAASIFARCQCADVANLLTDELGWHMQYEGGAFL